MPISTRQSPSDSGWLTECLQESLHPIAQASSAVLFLASLLLSVLFPEHRTLGATIPSGSFTQSFVLEVVLTFTLMFVIICVAVGAKEKGLMAGAAIGATVALCALFGGPVSGASMNPARFPCPSFSIA